MEVFELMVDGNNGETSIGEDKLTLDFIVSDTAVVILPDVISVDWEEIFDDKAMVGSVVLDVTAENSVFPVVSVSCNFDSSVVSMSLTSGMGNEVTASLITAKLEVMCEAADV